MYEPFDVNYTNAITNSEISAAPLTLTLTFYAI